MALNTKNIKQTAGTQQEPIDPGPYPGRVVQVIDLGLQEQRPWKGKAKSPVYKLHITYELVDEFMIDEEGEEEKDRPRWVSEDFPVYSLSADNAKSTERYKAIDPGLIHEGDFGAIGGMCCTVTVVSNPGKGANVGKTYSNVGSVAPMRKRDAATCPELVNDIVVFDLDNPDKEVFDGLPDWLQGRIKDNLEFAGSKLDTLLNGGSVPEPVDEPEEGLGEPEGGDEEW